MNACHVCALTEVNADSCWLDAALMQAEGTAWAKPVVVPSARGDVYPDSESSPLVPAGGDDYPHAQVSTPWQLSIPHPQQPMKAAIKQGLQWGTMADMRSAKCINSVVLL